MFESKTPISGRLDNSSGARFEPRTSGFHSARKCYEPGELPQYMGCLLKNITICTI